MALLEMNWRPSDRDLRLFSVVQFAMAAVAAWLIHRRLGWSGVAVILIAASLVGLVIGLLSPQRLRMLFVLWMLAAYPIGWVMSHVLLAIVYFGVVTPIGLCLRLRGRDSLQLKPRNNAESYWIARPAPPESARYFRQF